LDIGGSKQDTAPEDIPEVVPEGHHEYTQSLSEPDGYNAGIYDPGEHSYIPGAPDYTYEEDLDQKTPRAMTPLAGPMAMGFDMPPEPAGLGPEVHQHVSSVMDFGIPPGSVEPEPEAGQHLPGVMDRRRFDCEQI